MAGVAEGRLDLSPWPTELVVAANPDTVVFQRYVEDGQFDAIRRIREACPDALLVYELDDYLGEVPPASFHAGFMPPNLPERIRKAAALCDRVTVSTEPLARWFRDELGMPDVRVVANAVPGAALRPRPGRASGRLRIGFAGGISHAGDLELIRSAMAAVGDAVEWVFFGMQPRDPPVRVEFHPGVPPSDYQVRMMGLDLDLVLAPLEDNRFNRCKSNLRIVEAGMVGACAVAQRLEPYLDGDPPVVAYAGTPEEWTEAIRSFVGSSPAERTRSAERLQAWVAREHTLEKRMPARIDAWLRGGDGVHAKTWAPGPPASRQEDVVLALAEGVEAPAWLRRAPRKGTLVDACVRARSVGADVLWLRAGTAVDAEAFASLRSALAQGDNVGCAVPLASDGPNAFPRKDHWTPMTAETAAAVAEALRGALAGRRLVVAAPSGPCVLLSARALALVGFPDPAGCDGNEEQALMEWGLRLAAKGMRTVQAADAFAASATPPQPPSQKAAQRLQLRGYAQGLQGGAGEELSSRERIEAEMVLLRAQWAGPQPGTMGFGHDYASWSALRGDLPPMVMPDDGNFDQFGEVVVHPFGSPPAVLPLPETGWAIFTDETVQWKENGLATLAASLRDAPDGVAVVYGDNEFRGTSGAVYPDLKPDFDLELFLARDYVTPACAVRVSALGGATPGDRHALFAAILRIAEERGSAAIRHLSRFVATVRERASPEEAAMDAIGRQMVVEAQYGDVVKVSAHPALPGVLSVVRQWQARRPEAPLVSIIVPTLGAGRLIQPCVNSIRQHTRYPNFEILVVQNGPRAEPELGDAALADGRVRVVRWEPEDGEGFNWSRLSNDVARKLARGEFLCFVNDDVCPVAEGWLDAMMGHAVRLDIGAVGGRLVHPAGVVQHVGVVCHRGIAGHLHKGLPNGQPGNGWLALTTHEASAVTGACMLVSRETFDRAGGFDAGTFPMNYGDTDFCLRLRKLGLRNVVEATAELLHPEGTSRTDPADQAGFVARLRADNARFAARWPDPDPYWHPDLAIGIAQGGMSIPGLNRDMLAWPERRPAPDAPRTLLVNDLPGFAGQALARARAGEVCMAVDLSGLTLRLTAPIPANLVGWDVRDPATAAGDLRLLGVTRIVLRSAVGSDGSPVPVESMRFLAALGVPVDVELAEGVEAGWRSDYDDVFSPKLEAAD